MRFLNLVLFLVLGVLLVSCSYNKPMQGERGEPGMPGIGIPGHDGSSCTVSQLLNGALVSCENGSSAIIINGTDGVAGAAGTSCTVSQLSNGAMVSCQDGTDAVVLNGVDGTDTQPSAYSITQLVDPCGAQSSFDEVLLKTGDGSIIAHFSHGNKQFLSLIGPGNYVTTDGTNCYFSVDQNMNVTW